MQAHFYKYQGTGNDFVIGNATGGKSLRFFTGGYATTSERMRIDGSGNVGIGTTAAQAPLDVNVNFKGDELGGRRTKFPIACHHA